MGAIRVRRTVTLTTTAGRRQTGAVQTGAVQTGAVQTRVEQTAALCWNYV